jgi:hypothetical protein
MTVGRQIGGYCGPGLENQWRQATFDQMRGGCKSYRPSSQYRDRQRFFLTRAHCCSPGPTRRLPVIDHTDRDTQPFPIRRMTNITTLLGAL